MKRKLAFTAIIFLGTLISVQAQRKINNARTSKLENPKIAAELNITEAQKQQLKQQQAQFRSQEKKIETDTLLSSEQKRLQIKNLKKENKKQIALLLTDEQKVKLDSLKKKSKT
ncbi:MAG: hypothetical protein ACOVNY_07085 [Chitinophagaceae bacterium]